MGFGGGERYRNPKAVTDEGTAACKRLQRKAMDVSGWWCLMPFDLPVFEIIVP